MPNREPAEPEISGPLAGLVTAALRTAVRSQSGLARTYVARLREDHPEESPAQLRERLDSRFLSLVTVSGVAVGATGAVPGVGTVLAIGAIGAESLVFLEAAAFYTLAVAQVHGVDLQHREQEEVLVMTIMLGASGTALLSHAVGTGGPAAAGGPLAGRALRAPGMAVVHRRMVSRFVRRFAVKRATLTLGKLAPAGIGAAVGGWGNRRLGRTVVETAHTTFGAPPTGWSDGRDRPATSGTHPPVR